MSEVRPFHLALPTSNLEKTVEFYKTILGCETGRQDTHWVDFDFFGHQLVFHEVENGTLPLFENPVDSHQVPVPHFGVILNPSAFWELAERLNSHHITFVIEPYTRFKGLKGEQSTMFFKDPNGYALEFKAFENDSMIFEAFDSQD